MHNVPVMTFGWFRWEDILFAHWRVPARELKPRLPKGTTLDHYKGRSWVSLVALNAIGPVPKPLTNPGFEPILGYVQVNVRTYVNGPHGPGIVLLDTRVNSMIAAMGASLLGQPYRYASGMTVDRGRTRQRIVAPGGDVDVAIAPGAPATTVRGSLASFLVDRFVVYGELPGGVPYAARIEHEPWLLRDAMPGVTGAPLARLAGIEHAEGPLEAHVAEPVSVAVVQIGTAGREVPAPDRQ